MIKQGNGGGGGGRQRRRTLTCCNCFLSQPGTSVNLRRRRKNSLSRLISMRRKKHANFCTTFGRRGRSVFRSLSVNIFFCRAKSVSLALNSSKRQRKFKVLFQGVFFVSFLLEQNFCVLLLSAILSVSLSVSSFESKQSAVFWNTGRRRKNRRLEELLKEKKRDYVWSSSSSSPSSPPPHLSSLKRRRNQCQ